MVFHISSITCKNHCIGDTGRQLGVHNENTRQAPPQLFMNIVSLLIPCEQRLHFRGMSWRAKSSLCPQPFNFLPCMRKIRHAIRKQLVRQMCVSFAGIKIAKTTCEPLANHLRTTLLELLFCFSALPVWF